MSKSVEISNRNTIFQILQDTENIQNPRNIKRDNVHPPIQTGKRQALSTITNQSKNSTNSYAGLLRSKKQVRFIQFKYIFIYLLCIQYTHSRIRYIHSRIRILCNKILNLLLKLKNYKSISIIQLIILLWNYNLQFYHGNRLFTRCSFILFLCLLYYYTSLTIIMFNIDFNSKVYLLVIM